MMEFCDIGLNLTDGMFRGNYHGSQKHQDDLISVLERAQVAGVRKSILTGCTVAESIESLELCKTFPQFGLYSTAGIHPTRCNEFKGNEEAVLSQLETMIVGEETIVALGECGLDYDRLHFCKKDQQLKGFQLQLDLSGRIRRPLPLFLHNRNTDGDFIRIIRENMHNLKRGGVVHSFTGTTEEMLELVDLGLYIGVNGCSLKTAENLETVKQIPLELLMLETDAPWCGIKATHAGYKHIVTHFPVKKPEKYTEGFLVKDRNEPCLIRQVAEVVAAVREESDLSEFLATVYATTERVFFQP